MTGRLPGRPLDRVTSIKAKLGLLVGASVLVAVIVTQLGSRAAISAWLTVPVTLVVALGVVQVLARGMTSPLREMSEAARRMARGDYDHRVTATSGDEVGLLARSFNAMAAELGQADEQRRQLVANVAHELRTPLAAQRAVLENLADGVVPADDQTLGRLLHQCERLTDLVNSLLDLARLEAGATALRVETVPVAGLVEAALAEARLLRHRVVYETDCHPADLTVRVDPERLRQVLDNLLDNARRHSPEGGRIRVRAGSAGSGDWFLEVADEGEGIPADRRDLVFDRFGTSASASGGTGLGLAIARTICEVHGGTLTALAPAPGSTGARICAELPRQGPPPVRPEPAVGPELPASSAVPAVPADPDAPTQKESDVSTVPENPERKTLAAVPGDEPAPPPATVAQPGPVPGLVLGPRPEGGAVDAMFGRFWPEPDRSVRPGLLAAGLGAGLLTAVLVPGHPIGLGLAVSMLVCGAVMLWPEIVRRDRWTIACAAVGAVLSALVAVRGTPEVIALCILGGIGTAAVGSAAGRTALSLVLSPLLWALAAVRGLPLLRRTLAAVRTVPRLWAISRTLVLSVLALVVFGGLFASADAVMGSWARAVLPDLALDLLVLRGFVLVFVSGAVLAGTYLTLNPPRQSRLRVPAGRPVPHAWEWMVPVGVVIAVYLTFMLAQFTAMWGGHAYVQRTTGLSYGDYVHQGFGQLTVATALTLATVWLVSRKAATTTARDRLQLRAVLGVLCVLTLAVVASALYRMWLYQQALGFTKLRLFVDGFELWLGLVVVLVLIAGIRLDGSWIPRAAVLSAAVLLTGFALMNPDAWVAARNIDRFEQTARLDLDYLQRLGPDAAPVILTRLDPQERQCLWFHRTPTEPDPVFAWNLGRARAADAFATAEFADTTPEQCF